MSIYISSTILSIADKCGFHVFSGTSFKFIPFTGTSLRGNLASVTISRNPLGEVEARYRHVN